MHVFYESAFEDNLVWILKYNQGIVVIDPGTLTPWLHQQLERDPNQLKAILLTHKHSDHCAGVAALLALSPQAFVYGPEECRSWAKQLHPLKGGECIQLLGLAITVFSAPGHTSGHLVYYCSPYLWSGDTWFIWGCGRCFDMPSVRLYDTLCRLKQLPPSTLLCPGHDYAASNLKFLARLDPCEKRYVQAAVCCSHSIQVDQQLNPFLRVEEKRFAERIGWKGALGAPFFAWLRQLKDQF